MAFPQFEVLNTATEMDIARTITSEANGIHLTVTDSATSGTSATIRSSLTSSGTRSSGTASGLQSDVTITGQQQYVYPYCAYICQSGNPTIGFAAGYSVYLDNLGTGVEAIIGMDIGIAQSSAHSASRFGYIRMRSHAAQTPTAVFLLEGNPVADNLFKSDDQKDHGYIISGGAGGSTLAFTNWVKLRVQLEGSTTYYIPAAKTIA